MCDPHRKGCGHTQEWEKTPREDALVLLHENLQSRTMMRLHRRVERVKASLLIEGLRSLQALQHLAAMRGGEQWVRGQARGWSKCVWW